MKLSEQIDSWFDGQTKHQRLVFRAILETLKGIDLDDVSKKGFTEHMHIRVVDATEEIDDETYEAIDGDKVFDSGGLLEETVLDLLKKIEHLIQS